MYCNKGQRGKAIRLRIKYDISYTTSHPLHSTVTQVHSQLIVSSITGTI